MDYCKQLVSGINDIIALYNKFIDDDALCCKKHTELKNKALKKKNYEEAKEHEMLAIKAKADSIAYMDAVVRLKMLLERVAE